MKKPSREVSRSLVLSTAHAPSCQSLQDLLDIAPSHYEHCDGRANIIHVGDANNRCEWLAEAPGWLIPIVAIAHEEGCAYIHFDADVDLLDELESFEWADPFSNENTAAYREMVGQAEFND